MSALVLIALLALVTVPTQASAQQQGPVHDGSGPPPPPPAEYPNDDEAVPRISCAADQVQAGPLCLPAATVTFVNTVVGADDGTTFQFDAWTRSIFDGPSLAGGQSGSVTVAAGSVTVSESVPLGWRVIGLSCDVAFQGPWLNGGYGRTTIELAPGQTAVCTFTNEQVPGNLEPATVHVTKDASLGPNGDAFFFWGPSSVHSDIVLDGDMVTYTVNPNQQLFVQEQARAAGWANYDVSCVGTDQTIAYNQAVEVYMAPGATASCTFINVKCASNEIVVAGPDCVSIGQCDGQDVTVDIGSGQKPTAGDDVILGTSGDDVINAGDGDDVVCGLGGDDVIRGQNGSDRIFGDGGDDILKGGNDVDVLFGGVGADNLAGGRDNDWVYGQGGADVAVRGGSGNDYVDGGPGADLLVAGNGGEDFIRGGRGDDVLITGGPRPDIVEGGDGDDFLKGNGGADRIFGGDGDDELLGGPQSDDMEGGPGTDRCNGGTEVDAQIECEAVTSIP